MTNGPEAALEHLERWAATRGLYVQAILNHVELLTDLRSIGAPLIERTGKSKDEAAWYIINCLSRLGVEVPR